MDFLVDFAAPPGQYADAFFGLSSRWSGSSSVQWTGSSAIRNPYFQQSVDETRTLLYAA